MEAQVRGQYAHQWRDRKSEYERAVCELKFSENPVHGAWRRLSRTPWPGNPKADLLAQLTREWDDLNQ